LPRPLSFNRFSLPSTSLQKPRNITTSLIDNSSNCTLTILEVEPSPTKCVGTYSYLYFILYVYKRRPNLSLHYMSIPPHLSTSTCLCSQCKSIPHAYVQFHAILWCTIVHKSSGQDICSPTPPTPTPPPPHTLKEMIYVDDKFNFLAKEINECMGIFLLVQKTMATALESY
jgi:hypothetical protein